MISSMKDWKEEWILRRLDSGWVLIHALCPRSETFNFSHGSAEKFADDPNPRCWICGRFAPQEMVDAALLTGDRHVILTNVASFEDFWRE